MRRIPAVLTAVVTATIAVAYAADTSTPGFVNKIPSGYRDWRLISVAREAGQLEDIRAVLGNDIAIKAYRAEKLPYPDGTIIARLAWERLIGGKQQVIWPRAVLRGRSSEERCPVHDQGLEAVCLDRRLGYGHFENGKLADEALLKTRFPCHQAVKDRDFVFTRYAL